MNALNRFWNGETSIQFYRHRMLAYVLSSALMIGSVVSLFFNGLNFGLDFTGGTLVEATFPEAADLTAVRNSLDKAGLESAQVQHFGSARDVSVRVDNRSGASTEQVGEQIMAALNTIGDGKVVMKNRDSVSAQVGEELAEQGTIAALVTILAVLLYVAVRFEFKLAVGSIIGTAHDALLVLGVFSLFKVNFDLNALAAVMTILGYSLNDKVVIFDRVRENFRVARQGDVISLVNLSINQTLARTTMTTGLTFIVVAVLFVWGGPSLHEFALAMLIGVFAAIYSSIYLAACPAVDIGLSREDLIPKIIEKEGADQGSMPLGRFPE